MPVVLRETSALAVYVQISKRVLDDWVRERGCQEPAPTPAMRDHKLPIVRELDRAVYERVERAGDRRGVPACQLLICCT